MTCQVKGEIAVLNMGTAFKEGKIGCVRVEWNPGEKSEIRRNMGEDEGGRGLSGT